MITRNVPCHPLYKNSCSGGHNTNIINFTSVGGAHVCLLSGVTPKAPLPLDGFFFPRIVSISKLFNNVLNNNMYNNQPNSQSNFEEVNNENFNQTNPNNFNNSANFL